MLTHEKIVDAVARRAEQFSLKKVSYFGSYADGNATEKSDLDLLVEFANPPDVSLFTIFGLQEDLEEELNISVDVVTVPIPEKSYIKIGNAVAVYRGGVSIDDKYKGRISMKERDENILRKLKDETEILLKMTDGCDLQGFLGNEILKRAVSMAFINIGENVKRLSDETKQQHPVVPWSAIAGLRDVTAHGYDSLEMEEIWRIAAEDVPLFLAQIEKILQMETETD